MTDQQDLPDLQDCLPSELRGPSTTVTPIAAGLSGAGVYQVQAPGGSFVLKVARETQPLADWRRNLHIQQLAAGAGLAPPIRHVHEASRAILSAFVVDRSFPALYGTPDTREAALALLGQTVRRLQQIPPPAQAPTAEPRQFLAQIWSGLAGALAALPSFVAEAIQTAITEPPPAPAVAPVLSHNDVNPTNLVYDGRALLLLDWETAAPNDPFYDLATVAVFLRMDQPTCAKLLAAYDGQAAAAVPARFTYNRRLVATLCGANFLHLAHRSGHPGSSGAETLASATALGEIYQRIRAGTLSPATAEGQWCFGLALIKAGLEL